MISVPDRAQPKVPCENPEVVPVANFDVWGARLATGRAARDYRRFKVEANHEEEERDYFGKVNCLVYWEQVLSKLGFTAKRVGDNFLMLCVFHKERKPSLRFSEKKGIFRCFGCNRCGSVFTFVKHIKGRKGAFRFFRKHFGIRWEAP